MGLKDLDTERMISITGAWLSPGTHRSILARHSILAAMLPRLDQAHAGLLELQRHQEISAELSELDASLWALDQRHDRKARGLYYALTAFGDITDDQDKARVLLDLRDRIFPEGITLINLNYKDQIREVERAAACLTSEDCKELATLPTAGEKNLFDVLKDWLIAGREMAWLDTRRGEVERALKANQPMRGADMIEARNCWGRIVHAAMGTIEVELLTPQEHQMLMEPLQRFEATASRRRFSVEIPGLTSSMLPNFIQSGALPEFIHLSGDLFDE